MIKRISVWDVLKDGALLKQVQNGTQGITWKFSEDEWRREHENA